MKWKSHQAVTLITVYALFGDWLSALVSMQGSIWPDAVEMIFPFLRHRGLSHWFPVYLFPMAILSFLLPVHSGFWPMTLSAVLPAMITGSLSLPILLEVFLFWSLLGALLHLPEDLLCGSLPLLLPNRRCSGFRLFYIGSVKEYIFTILYAMLVLAWTFRP